MKRIKVLIPVVLILLISFPSVIAQEKKVEKKIKIVIDDNSGKRVLIDTLFNDDGSADSLKLKNGEVVYLRRNSHDDKDFAVSYGSSGTTGKPEGKEESISVTVISPDSMTTGSVVSARENSVYSISSDGDEKGDKRYVIISGLENGDKHSGRKYVYVSKDRKGGHPGEEKFDVITDGEVTGDQTDNTRYVVSKNGITVTIEGKDDAKVYDILKEVEKKLGISNDEKGGNQVVKETNTKSIKKK